VSSKYERELRQVLAGLDKGIASIIKSCNEIQKAKMRLVEKKPFLVVRAAGSGIEGSGDLLALRGDICFPIEVKSSKESKLYLSGRTVEQYKSLRYEGDRTNLMPLYAYRLKGIRGDSWRIFRVETSTLSGKLRLLSAHIPKLPLTRNGKPYLNWEQGLPLHEFISLVCSSSREDNSKLNQLKNRTKVISNSISNQQFVQQNNDRDILAELMKRKIA
tara:strand:+ start:789 stop:1439 length:651 start_codon:yes stop_codon:yes gene_type:complete